MLGQLLPFGPVRARSMFGGFGLFLDDRMFALIAFDTLYFKVDRENLPDYQESGAKPFTYQGRTKPIAMSYYQVPDGVMADPGELAAWAERAHAAALRSRKPKRKRK